jgi:ribosomal protein L22
VTDAEIRARGAQQLLENPLLKEALDQIEAEAIAAWKATKLEDTASRERLWMQVKAAQRVREVLEGAVENGRFEASRAARAPLP